MMNYAISNRFCPYMYSRRLSASSQIIVTTYNHILDKERFETLKAARENWREWMLICDEAHNIPELAYTLNSRLISKSDTEAAYSYALFRRNYSAASVASTFINLFKQNTLGRNEQLLVNMKELNNTAFKDKLRVVSSPSLPPSFNTLETRMQLSYLIEFSGSSFRSVVYLSATLGMNLSGFESYSIAKESSWSPACLTLIDETVTTAYSSRSEEMFSMIAARISNIRKILRGPMVVFFTSYEFLHKVQNALLETTLTHYLIEEKSMSIAEQD